MTHQPAALHRRLGLVDAVTLGLGAMLGAGVFVAFGPATAAAGRAVPYALALAAAVAWANADSSARLAALMPTSGGAYAYARSRLSTPWGVLAGGAFLVGKTISAGAIASAVGVYLWPDRSRLVAAGVVVVLTALACAGVRRGALVSRAVVGVVLVTLGAVVVAAAVDVTQGSATSRWGEVLGAGAAPADMLGVLQGAGILFFAFAGYARIATLGEEVRDPARTLPRAILVALVTVLALYAAVAATLVAVLGTDALATSRRPVAEAVEVLGGSAWVPVVGVVAACAALASGLGVLLGLSRTALAMSRDGVLPRALSRLEGRTGHEVPRRAQLLVGAAVALGVLVLDLPRAIAASSAAVLVYYAVAHLAALTLPGRGRRVIPVLGLAGCLVIAAALVVV